MIAKYEKWILTALIAVFVLSAFAVAVFKYLHFGYNGLDLAIYNQAFWNTIHGRLFGASINPPSYLSDHAEWLILALAPFYALVPHPLTLLFLKIVAVGSAAIPLWLIAKLKFKEAHQQLLFPFLWLANPFIWNITLFEFHLITFSLPLVLWAAYFFLKKRWGVFLLFAIAILLCREDMAFAVVGFALLAALDIIRGRKKISDLWRWIVIPVVLATIVFFVDQQVIKHFNPDGAYKFFVFYSWLGDSPLHIITAIFTHPDKVFLNLLRVSNAQIIAAFLLPTLGLAILRPKFLLLCALTAAEFALTQNGSGLVILRTQYAAGFLPALALATMEGYEYLLTTHRPFQRFPKPMLPVVVALATVYTWLAFGPGPGVLNAFARPTARMQALSAAVALIPKDAPVIASMDTLTNLSSRQNVWPLSYVWIGKKQFGFSPYVLPVAPEYVILDNQDFVYFTMVYSQVDWSKPGYPLAAKNFRDFITAGNYGVIYNREDMAVLKKGVGGALPFVTRYATMPPIVNRTDKPIGPLKFLGWNPPTVSDNAPHLFFSAAQSITTDMVITVDGKYYPLGNGLYPTSEWKSNEVIEVAPLITNKQFTFGLAEIKGGLNLDASGGIIIHIDSFTDIGGKISIP